MLEIGKDSSPVPLELKRQGGSIGHVCVLLVRLKNLMNNLVKVVSAVLSMATLLGTLFSSSPAFGEAKGTYLYNLSDFNSVIPYTWARIVVDKARTEIYVLSQNLIRVFNPNGMELYNFGDDLDVGAIVDVTVDSEGNPMLLTYDPGFEEKRKYFVRRCNYRGVPIDAIELKGLPEGFSKFTPTRLIFQNNKLYFSAPSDQKIVVASMDGTFIKGYDIAAILEEEKEKDVKEQEPLGFNVDKDGNIYFTLPTLFRVYKITAEGKVSGFGQVGGIPGRFGVIAGVAVDDRGNIFVVDKLKCLVAVFDKDYRFIGEFGYRGYQPGRLIAPDDIAIDSSDRVYVSQAMYRGVSVYKVTFE